jgi:hypothetical protein
MLKHSLRALLVVAALPLGAAAAPPEACKILTIEELNATVGGGIEMALVRKTGNPTECAFSDARKAAIVVIALHETYGAENELQHERENLEKIYRSKAKWLNPPIGENAFWLPGNKQLMFRKGRIVGSVTFQRPKNQNEVDTAQIARLVEAQIK